MTRSSDKNGAQLRAPSDEGEPVLKGRWPEALIEMRDVTVYALRDDIGEEAARKLGEKVVLEIARYMGGRCFYLPNGRRLERFVRNQNIWEDHTAGMSVNALAKRYRLTHASIYQILDQQRTLRDVKK